MSAFAISAPLLMRVSQGAFSCQRSLDELLYVELPGLRL